MMPLPLLLAARRYFVKPPEEWTAQDWARLAAAWAELGDTIVLLAEKLLPLLDDLFAELEDTDD